jgi:hypothetical protein
MKKYTDYRYTHDHDAVLAKAEREILEIYDLFRTKGIIASQGLVNKQIDLLKQSKSMGSGIKYQFTCR